MVTCKRKDEMNKLGLEGREEKNKRSWRFVPALL